MNCWRSTGYVPTNDPFEALLDAIIPLNFSDSMQFDVSEEQLERERQFIDGIIDKVNGSTACMPIQLDDLLSAGEVLLAPGPDVILVITDGCPECQRVLGEAPTTFSLEDVMKVIDEMMAALRPNLRSLAEVGPQLPQRTRRRAGVTPVLLVILLHRCVSMLTSPKGRKQTIKWHYFYKTY